MQVKPIWSVSDGIGVISPNGVFSATRYIGDDRTGTIIATVPELNEEENLWQAITQVQIKPANPKRIALMPKFVRLSAGEQQQFYLAVMDAYDNEIPVDANELIWNVSSDIGIIENTDSHQSFPYTGGIFTASKMGRGVVQVKWHGTEELTAVSEIQVDFGGLEHIAVSPPSTQIAAGQKQTFISLGFDSQDNLIPIAPIWSVRNSIGAIQPDGRFTAGLAGDGTIVATIGDLVAEVPVTVTTGKLSKITIDPFIDYLPLSTAKAKNYHQFIAFGWDAGENPVPIENLRWTVDKAAGTIDNTGLFIATTDPGTPVGNVVINGSVFAKGGKNLSAKSVVVIQSYPPKPPERIALFMENFGSELPKITMSVGEKKEFEVTGFDANAQRIRAGGGVPRFSVIGDIGFISPDGIFTATKSGIGEILAVDAGLTARITVEVTKGTLKSIAIKPEFFTLPTPTPSQEGREESHQFTALGFDQFDNAVFLDDIKWSINPQGYSIPPAIVDEAGKVTAKHPGVCQLVASIGDIEGYAQIFVQPGKLHHLRLFILDGTEPVHYKDAKGLQLISGGQVQFIAKGYDIAGNEVTVIPDWHVSNMIGRIAFDGNFTAVKAGEGIVTASHASISASVKVQVTPEGLHHIEVYPNPLNLTIDANPMQQFQAEGYDIAGNLICQPMAKLSWHVIGDLGTIDGTGLFRVREDAKGSGYVVVTPDQYAEFIHQDGIAYISVTDFESEKIKKLVIVPNESATSGALTLSVGETQKFYSLGITDVSTHPRPLQGGEKVFPVLPVWNVTNSIGYIDANGNLTTTAVGNGKVTATLSGISVDCPILILPSNWNEEVRMNEEVQLHSSFQFGDISEIITIPDAVHAKAGDFIRINAVGKDSPGNLLPINPSWLLESSTPNLGSLSSNGLFIGNKSGKGRIIVSASGVSAEIPVEVIANRPTFALIQPEKAVLSANKRTPIQFGFLTSDSRGNPTTTDILFSQIQWKAIGDIGTIDREGRFTPSSLNEELHGEVIAFVPELNLLARSNVILHGDDSFVNEIRIEPDKIDLIRGTTYRFRATVFDSLARIVDIPVKWQVFNSNNSEIIDGITPDGVFSISRSEADIGEQFRVVASVESRIGIMKSEALVTIISGALDTIEIENQAIRLNVGETTLFSAFGHDSYSNSKEIRPTWQVIGNIGTINPESRDASNAIFTATSEGIGTIIATQEGIVGKAEISVFSEEPSVDEIEITVGAHRQYNLEIPPDIGETPDNPLQIQSGDSVSFSARDYITKEILSPEWSVISESPIGRVSIYGQFIARQVGEGKIQAVVDSPIRTAAFFIRVIPDELASIQVTPAIVSDLTKNTQQFSAEGYDAYGNLVISSLSSTSNTQYPMSWNVTGGIGTIDASGIFAPTKIPLKSSIQGTVVASVSDICFPTPDMGSGIGVYGSASVAVVSELGSLSVISMTAEPLTIEAGGFSVISILGADDDGNPIASTDFEAPITFTLTPNIGQIIPATSGDFHYHAPEKLPSESEREITISVTTTIADKTLTAEILLSLTPSQPAQVQFQPKSLTLKAGETQQFQLTAYDTFGNPTPVTSQWQLSKPLGALSDQQSNSVTYTATSVGEVELSVVTFGVSAAGNPIRAAAVITVQPNEPTILRIEPDAAVIVSGEKREFQVIGIDAYNNEINDLEIDWYIDGDVAVGNLEPISDKPASQIFSAVSVGNVSIVAKFQSVSAQARVQVIHGVLSNLKILLVAELVSGWQDVEVQQSAKGNFESLFQPISGGKYVFRAVGQDEHKNEFSPPVRWTLKEDIGKIGPNPDDSSFVLYQATFMEKGRLLATSDSISTEVTIEVVPVSQKIGNQGGHIDSPSGASLIIPPGGLKNETEINIAIIHPPEERENFSNSPLHFLPFPLDFQPGGLIFRKPAQLSVSY